jgi:hypothetical protein
VPLRAGGSADSYSLLVGLYDPVSEERLPTSSGGDAVRLTDIELGDQR